MSKKSEKRICWNCDGDASLHLSQCPYCGVDLTQSTSTEDTSFKGFGSPFQSAAPQESIPKSPYAKLFSQDVSITEEEWNKTLDKEDLKEKDKQSNTTKREMVAFFLFLPGIVFFLFGLILLIFSSDGVLTLTWSQNLGLFYFIGALPFLYLGWRALR